METSDGSVLRIAVAQSTGSQDPSEAEIRANGKHVRELMRQAHDQGARLILFPEGALSGYPSKHLMSRTSPEAGPADWDKADWLVLRAELDETIALAGELELWTVIGSIHRLTGSNRPHNSVYVISAAGELVDRYDKRLLSFTEISHLYTPGTAPVVFDVEGYRFGCAVCIEVNYPELFLEYERLGVDCVLFSSYSEDPMFGVLAQGHAAGNSYWLAFSVPAQYSPSVPAGVIAPNGEWVARGSTDGLPDVVLFDLDPSAPDAEEAVTYRRPWRLKARSGLYNEHFVTDPRSQTKTLP
ncbi:MAG TPA: carbon-nitrogen hydrolase family protein [Kribbella sp.]|uniref:carbon-nitrogen hydrolase family protein n=1 Tax=Kribbella sp. TaxID=1871183 RepID=UPI002D765F1D|nr:carbon-nitrogen hydrolase family protein [Kribbella sp.]HET6295076.1 carbon-nitrogen hydrolase family protein [Kribbella sp.]